MNKGKLIVFSAPSGSGKTTIVKHLLEQPELNLEFSISAATRNPRDGEINGKDYYFISLEEFKKHIKHEDFDIDVAGGLRIKKKFPEETLAVFVKPPSIDELKIRLKKRSTESEDKINMRIAKASVELATAPQFDTIIKNYDLDTAKQDAYNLVKEFIK